MISYCKNIDITDPEVIIPWICLCLAGKEKREDFKRLLATYHDVTGIAKEIIKRINNRNLNLRPILLMEKRDGMNGKLRLLGVEEPLQQCMDYIAVYALMPLFKAKIGVFQCASLPKRGQIYGKRYLERWVNRDFKHSKFYIKADIYHCYQSIEHSVVEKHLKRDIKNPTLLWFVMAIIDTHPFGLSIGSFLSQYLCNYLLSYTYHYATEKLEKTRRNKRVRLCYHVLFYMDDLYICSNDKRNLTMAIKKIDKFLQKDLGVHLKPNYTLKDVSIEPIDMMGYVIHRKYTTIRAKIFLRLRHCYLHAYEIIEQKHYLALRSARRVISYYGYLVNSNSKNFCSDYHVFVIYSAAIRTISFYAKRRLIYA